MFHGVADQAINQGERHGFLPCPQVVCPRGPRLSPGAPLPGGAGLGLLGQQVGQNLRAQGVVCPKSGEIFLIFRESYAIRWSCGDSGPQMAFFGNFALANRPPKPFFGRGGQACRIISGYAREGSFYVVFVNDFAILTYHKAGAFSMLLSAF
jgi:hypothetical protein